MTKNKVGPPFKYKPEYCDKIIEYGKQGKSMTQMACLFNIDKQTIYNWCDAFPEFKQAYEMAKQHSQAWWEDKGQEGLESNKFNATLWGKNVSCRFPKDWRETTQQDSRFIDGDGNDLITKSDIDLLRKHGVKL